MHRRYRKSEDGWSEGLVHARTFIGGPLHRHVSTWPRYGQFGVQEYLDCGELRRRLPRLLDQRGEFVLVFGAEPTSVQLLVVEVGGEQGPIALCYGPWPGIDAWVAQVEPALSPGLPLSHSFWNRMPRLEDLGGAGNRPDASVVERRRLWLDENAAGVPAFSLIG